MLLEYSLNASITTIAHAHNLSHADVIAALRECGVTDVRERSSDPIPEGFTPLGVDLKPVYSDEELDNMTLSQMRMALSTNASLIGKVFVETRRESSCLRSENTRLKQEVVRLRGRVGGSFTDRRKLIKKG